MTLNEVLTRFTVSKKLNDSSYQCQCPVHRDKKASLTISEKGGKILFCCHAGCNSQDIVEKVGLTFKDIEGYKKPTWRERLEYTKGKKIEAVYNYVSEQGEYMYSKIRFEGKEITYITLDEKNDVYHYGRGSKETVLYNLPKLIKSIEDGYPVYIVEGEKDADTLNKLGYTATTAGGVKDWKKEFARYFIGAQVVILPDNDVPGRELKDRIVKDLKHYAHSIKWCITSEVEKGDVTDYLVKEKHTKEELKELIAKEKAVGAPWIYIDEKTNKIKINAGKLANSVDAGLNYKIVKKQNDNKDEIYVYENGIYSLKNTISIKAIIKKYIPSEIVTDHKLNETCNIFLCRNESDDHVISYEDFDSNENYINFKNGLYNIKTKTLEKHNPNVLSKFQLQCDYNPDCVSRPNFKRFIDDLCMDNEGNVDEDKQKVIQEFFGLIISNVKMYRLKKALVLYSKEGNAGKSLLFNIIARIIGGKKTANIPIQSMNEKSRFFASILTSVRCIMCGDQGSVEIEDSSVFKQITGGDTIKIEAKGKEAFYIIYSGGIAMASNTLPAFKDDKGGHIFERLCIVPCDNWIPPEKRDSTLFEKIVPELEAVVNWLLVGLHRVIDNGYKLSKSQACEFTVNEYHAEQDTIYDYLLNNFIITRNKSDVILKTKFDDDYSQWCVQNNRNSVSKKNIKDRMKANGCPCFKGKIGDREGVMGYRCLKPIETKFESVTKDDFERQNIPFSYNE